MQQDKTLANHQSFLPQIYRIFNTYLSLLGHSPNCSPNSLNLLMPYPANLSCYRVYQSPRLDFVDGFSNYFETNSLKFIHSKTLVISVKIFKEQNNPILHPLKWSPSLSKHYRLGSQVKITIF